MHSAKMTNTTCLLFTPTSFAFALLPRRRQTQSAESFLLPGPRRTPQKREVDRIDHRFVAGRAGVKVVARVVAVAKLTWVIRITHGSIEVENTVKSSAGSDPLIDGLTCSFSIGGVVAGAFIRSQCRAEYPDPLLMRTFNDLLQTHNEVRCARHLVSERHLRGCSTIFRWRLEVRPSDVVDPLQYDQV